MTIAEINKLLGTNYSSIELFEKNATWEQDIKGKSINYKLINEFPNKINWNHLSQLYKLSEDFIKSHSDRVNWEYISQGSRLSEYFMREFKDKISWYNISIYQILSENFIEEFHDKVVWSKAIEFQKFTESFIEKHISKFDITSILTFQDISSAFIERNKPLINWKNESYSFNKIKDDKKKIEILRKYGEYLEWNQISKNWNLSAQLIIPFADKVDWKVITQRLSLSEDFIREFHDKLNLKEISRNNKLSEEFIEEFNESVDWDYVGVRDEYSLPFIRKHKEKLKRAKFTTNDITLIRELKDSISFEEINYKDFSDELLYEFRDKVNWENIIKYKKLSESLINKVTEFFGVWEWKWLSDIQPLTEEFIRKNCDKVHWGGICMYQNLSEEFIEEFGNLNKPFNQAVINNMRYNYENNSYETETYIWWEYILKYQKLSSEFSKKISSESWSKRKYKMLPYQKNIFTIQLLDTLSEEEINKYVGNSWLYKSRDFRKEQVINLKLDECFDDYFIASIIVDNNRFQPLNFHFKFEKQKTYEIFATQTEEESNRGHSRTKGFIVGDVNDLFEYYGIDTYHSKREYYSLKVKVYYEDVARIVGRDTNYKEKNKIIRCCKLYVMD